MKRKKRYVYACVRVYVRVFVCTDVRSKDLCDVNEEETEVRVCVCLSVCICVCVCVVMCGSV